MTTELQAALWGAGITGIFSFALNVFRDFLSNKNRKDSARMLFRGLLSSAEGIITSIQKGNPDVQPVIEQAHRFGALITSSNDKEMVGDFLLFLKTLGQIQKPSATSYPHHGDVKEIKRLHEKYNNAS